MDSHIKNFQNCVVICDIIWLRQRLMTWGGGPPPPAQKMMQARKKVNIATEKVRDS